MPASSLVNDDVSHETVEFAVQDDYLPMRTADIEMLQDTKATAPFSKLRERAFEGAFFGVALLAMAGWVYFITLLLSRFFLWCLG